MKGRKVGMAAIMLVLTGGLIVLSGEGLYALIHFSTLDTSATYRLWSTLSAHLRPALEADTPTLRDMSQITPYLDAFKANGVALGNSPFNELRTELASTKHIVDGCEQMKPGQRKTMGFLRSELFNNFDPLDYFYDTDRQLPDEVRTFLDRYSFGAVQLTTNEHGERLTLPSVELPDKILVAGDSMGMSAMVDDSETLASQLQAADSRHQYINIGIGGADAEAVVCALQRAAQRYTGQIRAVIYPFSENDFGKAKPYQHPQELVPWLEKYRTENGIRAFSLIYMSYIYNTVPELTRIPGHKEYGYSRHAEEKTELLGLARQAGFRVFDYTDIVREEQELAGSLYAGLALYVDHQHLSRLGIQRLVAKLAGPDGSLGAALVP